jgi:phage terminase large subunit GpA-like protein
VPTGASILCAGVDVQDNRVEVGLYAYGKDEECWLISHTAIYGDPAGQKLWDQVDDVVLRDYPHADGGRLKVSAIGVDSGGHYTSEVYAYARSRKGKGVFALKGQSVRNNRPKYFRLAVTQSSPPCLAV